MGGGDRGKSARVVTNQHRHFPLNEGGFTGLIQTLSGGPGHRKKSALPHNAIGPIVLMPSSSRLEVTAPLDVE